MRTTRLIFVVLIVVVAAGAAAAQDPAGPASRVEYLLRRMDAGLLPTPMLSAMLQDPYSETKIFAVRVAASSADPGQVLLLWEYARDRDFRVRYEAMVAAGRLGERGRELALSGLLDDIPRVRQAAAWAVCHGGTEGLEPLFEHLMKEPDVGVRATAWANMWRFDGAAWEGRASVAASDADPQIRRAVAYSLARSESESAQGALRRLAADSEPVIRATAIAGLRRRPLVGKSIEIVAAAVTDADPRVRTAACMVLAEQRQPALSKDVAAQVAKLWVGTEPQTAVLAIRAAGSRPEIGDDAALIGLARGGEPWLAVEAFSALVRRNEPGLSAAARGPDDAAKTGGEAAQATGSVNEILAIAGAWSEDPELWRRRALSSSSPGLGPSWEALATSDGADAVRLAWLESLRPDDIADRLELLAGLVENDPDPMVRTAALNHLAEAGATGGLQRLLDLASGWRGDAEPDARAAALAAAFTIAETDEQRASVLQRAVEDDDPAVGVLVVNIARSAGYPARSHEREPRHNHAWYLDLVDWMAQSHWLDVVTDRGTVRIQLASEDAPITAREIYDLAEQGFYDGLTFHRVVPNFVVQGGDPRGDGWGGAGFILPDEPSFRPFDTGSVGIATGGPNTGSCQLFITLMPADHLTGHYTNFGEVTSGRKILSRIRVGDRIRRIEAYSDNEPPTPDPVLLGRLEWSDLEEIPGWFEEYHDASPDPAAIERLRSATGSYRIVTVLGTWCHDSRREVPRLVRVLDELELPVFSNELIGVDRTRRIDDPDLAASVEVERTVERVATIVVLDDEGVERGRIVETADRPIEELLVDFIAPAEGWDF